MSGTPQGAGAAGEGRDLWVWTVVPHTGSPQPVTCTRVCKLHRHKPSPRKHRPLREEKGQLVVSQGLCSVFSQEPWAQLCPFYREDIRRGGEERWQGGQTSTGSSRTGDPRAQGTPPWTVGPPAPFLPLGFSPLPPVPGCPSDAESPSSWPGTRRPRCGQLPPQPGLRAVCRRPRGEGKATMPRQVPSRRDQVPTQPAPALTELKTETCRSQATTRPTKPQVTPPPRRGRGHSALTAPGPGHADPASPGRQGR